MLLVLVLTLIWFASIYGHVYFSTPQRISTEVPAGFALFIECLSAIETGSFGGFQATVSFLSVIKSYVSIDGMWHCFKMIILAIANHSSLIFVQRRSSRWFAPIATRLSVRFNYCFAVLFGAFCLLVFCPPLHWVLWTVYTYILALIAIILRWLQKNKYFLLPSIMDVWYSGLSHEEVAVTLGPVIVHLMAVNIWTLPLRLFNAVPHATRTIRHLAILVYGRPSSPLHFLWDCIRLAMAATLCSIPPVGWLFHVAYLKFPFIKRTLWQYPFLCRRWRNAVRRVYWFLVWEYRDNKHVYCEAWPRFFRWLLHAAKGKFDLCLEAWYILGVFQRLLIVLPAAAYYGYFYILPAARTTLAMVRRWQRR